MAKTNKKKTTKNTTKKTKKGNNTKTKLDKKTKEKIKKIQAKVDLFQEKLLEKFDKYVLGIGILPPNKKDSSKINLVTLIDDSDSEEKDPEELSEKLDEVVKEIAQKADPNLEVVTATLREIKELCFDSDYEKLELISESMPTYTKGLWMSALKLTHVHKKMVLEKFENYIVSYVLSGSIARGQSTDKSDIDVFVVVDDTDVKQMTRAELKDRLRGMILNYGFEAKEVTGIKNELNIQTYILSDFWDSLKDASPVIYTLLRDGVPLFDRGMFAPWKRMLEGGMVKPSAEAIDIQMHAGEEILKRAKRQMYELAMEDLYYALLNPSQAAIMLYGIAPPAHTETPKIMREIFVEKEKILEKKYVQILEDAIKIRKELEHNDKKSVSGKEIDELIDNAEEYLKRIGELFVDIQRSKLKQDMIKLYDTTTTVTRDILKTAGVESVQEQDLVLSFKKELVDTGRIPEKFYRILLRIMEAKSDHDKGKLTLTKTEIDQLRKDFRVYFNYMVEIIERERSKEIEIATIKVRNGEKFGEVILAENKVFIKPDLNNEEEIYEADLLDNKCFGEQKKITLDYFDKVLKTYKFPTKVFVKENLFEEIKKVFGQESEVLVNTVVKGW